MKTIRMIIVPLAAALATLGLGCCSTGYEKTRETKGLLVAPEIPGVEFNYVPASSFAFNAVPSTLRTIIGSNRQFQVFQSGFWMSTKPITKKYYELVMGKGKYPKAGISYNDAQAFLDALYRETDVPVVLPTEAMYEAALWRGLLPVDTEKKLIVSDRWWDGVHPDKTDLIKNPPRNWRINQGENDYVTIRQAYERIADKRFRRTKENAFYICVREVNSSLDELKRLYNHSEPYDPEPSDGKDETFTVNGVKFRMKAIPSGTLSLGATPEQAKYAETDEQPAREVSFEAFKLSETEVTRELWNAVIGSLPAGNTILQPHVPVGGVNWYDAQRFVQRLSELTGRPFRIPSEDEWEYAARGGCKSKGYMFAGSNISAETAVCSREENNGKLSDVKSLTPNELGLYDMSGNIWEWVRGTHPEGPAILRGGSYNSRNTACRVSNRQPMAPEIRKGTFGLRIAL